jgi:hypothetical protein
MAYGDIKQLASLRLHETESIVYSAPTSRSVELLTFWFHNSSSLTVNAQMFFPYTSSTATQGSSSAIQRFNENFTSSLSLEISPKVPFVLNSRSGSHSESITMKASVSESLNVIIYGREQI